MKTITKVILGLDLSLTCTGWAAVGQRIEYGGLTEWNEYGTIAPKTKGVQRLHEFAIAMHNLLNRVNPDLVVIENYAFGARFAGPALGELGGVVRLAIYKAGMPFIAVPPTTAKKFVTGKGNAEKGNVMSHCLHHWGVLLENNNIADAYGLAKFGQCLAKEGTGWTKYQTDAVAQYVAKHKEADDEDAL